MTTRIGTQVCPRNVDDVLAKLTGVKKRGNYYRADCPAPGHKTPQGHLKVTDVQRMALVRCYPGGKHSYEEISAALGFDSLTYSTNGSNPNEQQFLKLSDTEAMELLKQSYGLTDETVLHFGIKPERDHWKYPVNGGFRYKKYSRMAPRKYWHTEGIQNQLYGLSDVPEGTKGVWLVNGEPAVWVSWQVGIPGVCGIFGEGDLPKDTNQVLKAKGVQVVNIIPDLDDAGREAAIIEYQSLRADFKVHIRQLPDYLGEKGDVCDLFIWHECNVDTFWKALAGLPEAEPAILEKEAGQLPSTNKTAFSVILTDTTNAELIAQLYGERLRYDHQRGRWLLWSGHYWQEDADGEIYRQATASARERYRQAENIKDVDNRRKVANWAIGSEQRGRLEAAVALARTVKPIADDGKHWDADPWLFAVANGVVDLKTGALRSGEPEDRITLHSPVVYDEAAKCPRWLQFLDEIFRGDSELIHYIHRALGYSLTGITKEQVYFMAYGTGSNGKGKFTAALRYVFGDYAYDAPFSTFEQQNRASIPNDLAAIERRRFITSSETNDGTRLNEARIKALSGEDPCTARYLYHELFTFLPVCKIWLSVNHKPQVQDDSYGFWRRVRLIPFTRQFKGSDADKDLHSKLLSEASGILNWLIAGCLEWQRRGLEPVPASVVSATEAYQAESDPLAEFIADCCVLSPGTTVKACDIYSAYCKWAKAQGLNDKETLTNNKFGRRLMARFEGKHTREGKTYDGIGLLKSAGKSK